MKHKRPYTPKQIKRTRLALDMSKEAFARSIGVNARTVFRWEAGESVPSGKCLAGLDTLFRIRSLAPPVKK